MKKFALILVTLCCCANLATAGEKVFVAESFANQVGVLASTVVQVPLNFSERWD